MARSASLKVMLTARERTGLQSLGYRPDEIDDMRLELAERVLQRRTRRPFGAAPMPASWRKSGVGHSGAAGCGPLLLLALLALALAWLTGRLPLPLPRTLEPAARALRGSRLLGP
eukprot:CAMPEP_0171116920 /NCGR_PEP_ID=MMETSP0766_2-20121228/91371_1 /TAXON_ID=439317 /ORGANISM="Gambierdiscus australes, Strain CAWD 149" /LENGTH=114 /DNA_ID=CAMNT_0011579399 /DNA_START=1 /DNA_END=345 /DNA_ORIENTATION=+